MRRILRTCVAIAAGCFVISAVYAQEEVYLGGVPPGSEPLQVQMGISLVNITDVNEREETLSFEGVLTMTWMDARLAHDPAVVGLDEFAPGDYSRLPRRIYLGDFRVKEVFPGWRPHIVFPNGIRDRQTTNPAVGVWPDGRVFYTETFSAVVETPMELRRYPFDKQQLKIFVHLFPYSRSEVVLVPAPFLSLAWNKKNGYRGMGERGYGHRRAGERC